MADSNNYRIDGGLMLLKNNGGTVNFVAFVNDQPEAHARIKELSGGQAALAEDYFLVSAERLLPVAISEEPV